MTFTECANYTDMMHPMSTFQSCGAICCAVVVTTETKFLSLRQRPLNTSGHLETAAAVLIYYMISPCDVNMM